MHVAQHYVILSFLAPNIFLSALFSNTLNLCSSLGRPRRRWEDNIKMDLREVGCDPRDWIALAEDRDQWRTYIRAVMDLRIP